MTAPPMLSIVIPTHNRRDVLVQQALPAIFAQDLAANLYEVIIVLDGCTDGTGEALRKLSPAPSLQIIEQPKSGPSVARNRGIQAAKGEVILFLDDDIICGPHLLQQHLDAHRGAQAHVVHGRISVAPGTPPSLLKAVNEDWYGRYYARLDSQGGLKWPTDDYLISNSSLPRATMLACGGFDEHMPAKEDYELGLRLWKLGTDFQYLPGAAAYEFFVKSTRHTLHKDGDIYGRTEVLLSRKHPEYRPLSPLAELGRMGKWRRWKWQILARTPISLAGLLAAPLWTCEKLCRFSLAGKAGHRLLGVGRGIEEFRAATREAGSWKTLEREFSVRLPVLLYHHVGPLKPGTITGLSVSPQTFERHMGWLARWGYQGICPADWGRWRREGKGLPEKPILLTFDDGYADLAEYAFPVLRRYGFGAAVYLVTSQLGGTNAWDAVRSATPHPLLSTEQIRTWAGQGIEFGAHTRTHADLRALSAEDLREEVLGSRNDLEKLLGSSVVSFAYPFGYLDEAAVECVRGAFELAFIADDMQEGLDDLKTDPHLLLRTMVQTRDSRLALACRARWGFYPFMNLRMRIGLRTRLRRAARSIRGGGN